MPKETKSGVAAEQTDVLCTFFEDNPEVIKGYKKTPKGIDAVKAKWKQITPQLNTLGAARDYKSWAKYLCNVKAKLKRKRIKWRQNHGSAPVICNADDFSEIELRMLQVLRKKNIDIQDPQDCNTNPDNEDYIQLDKPEDSSFEADYTDRDPERLNKSNHTCIKLVNCDSSVSETQMPTVFNDGDEFDTFGKNIAQQLRTLPLPMALETQEMLLSVIRNQRLKVLSSS